MLSKFGGELASDYLMDCAIDKILRLIKLFAKNQPKNLVPSNDSSLGRKLKFVMCCVDKRFDAGIFTRAADWTWGEKQIAENAPSPLPSVFMNGELSLVHIISFLLLSYNCNTLQQKFPPSTKFSII